ncbi:hypothetical protein pEaSNUABM11_00044 [Erwinia phage pEa_SNUABM_11]|nr:hypothetical protein pEaSNUABM11_00044 [Erwinia phage pEa_SNUABM_11]
MKLVNMLMYPVYGIPEQIRRRMSFQSSLSAMDDLKEIVSREGRSAVKSQNYHQALGDIVGFDGTPGGVERPLVNVGEGNSIDAFNYNKDDTGVYNFIAVLVADPINETRSQETQFIITGYTSRAEQSLTGMLPDDMVLYINDVYGLQQSYGSNLFGVREVIPGSERMLDNFVLSQALSVDNYQESTIDLISLAKSADMVRKIQLGSNEQYVPDSQTLFSPVASTQAQLMSSRLTSPGEFVNAMSTSYLKSRGQESNLTAVDSFFDGEGANGVQKELNGMGVMRSFASFPFIRSLREALQKNTGLSSDAWKSAQKANFRLMDIRAAIDNAEKLDLDIATSLNKAFMDRTGIIEKTDDWLLMNDFSAAGSLVAFDISMQLSQIMARSKIGAIAFTFDNKMADFVTEPQMQVMPNSAEALMNTQLSDVMAQQFLGDLKRLFVTVTKHNNIRFDVFVAARLGTVNRVEITMDGELMREFYTFASFMSNRLHIGNTTDLKYVGQLAKDTERLFTGIDEGYNDHERTAGKSNLQIHLPDGPSTGSAGLGGLGLSSDFDNFSL